MNKPLVALAVSLACLAGTTARADSMCKYTDERSANVDGGGIRKVVVLAGAGDLAIRGEEGRQSVKATGTACASSEQLLQAIRIESRREGDTVYLKTVLREAEDSWFGFMRYAYLDLRVAVPRSAILEVEDSSGDLDLHHVHAASVEDSSGDQTIGNISGDLQVRDSSGEITISAVAGRLKLSDSSGDVDVSGVRGDVLVEVDSSGDLSIEDVDGSVRVNNDSSGDIEISDVQRDVTIDADSSGSIRVERVGGDFTVGADGSGSISYERVLGAVRVPGK